MSLKHAILSMLEFERGSGYDLVKRFNRSIGFFWDSTFQQIYKDLQTMENQQLVVAKTVEQVGKPDKKVYDITDAGTQELREWLEKPAKSRKMKDTLLIKIFSGRQTSRKTLLNHINTQRAEHEANLEKYQSLAKWLNDMAEPEYSKNRLPYQTLLLGIKYEKAWLEWAAEVEGNLNNMAEEQFRGEEVEEAL